MQGARRKLLHAILFEFFAICLTTALVLLFSDSGGGPAAALAVSTSVIAMLWNMGFNTLFEAWERRQADRRRTLRRRALHALGFEGGLVVLTVPVIAWWLEMGWWQALLTDLGLVAFFLVYTFAFNWVFDRVFGLPASANPSNKPSASH